MKFTHQISYGIRIHISAFRVQNSHCSQHNKKREVGFKGFRIGLHDGNLKSNMK